MHQHQPAKTLHEGIAGLKGFGLVAHFIRLCRLLYFLHGFYYGEIISSFCGQSIKCGGGSNRAFIRHPLVKQFLPLPACRAGDTAGLHLEACQSFLQAPSSYTLQSCLWSLLRSSGAASLASGLTAAMCHVPGMGTLGLILQAGCRGQAASWFGGALGEGTPLAEMAPGQLQDPVHAFWVFHRPTWLFTLKGIV